MSKMHLIFFHFIFNINKLKICKSTNKLQRKIRWNVIFQNMYIRLYVSETFETNSRSNVIYRKTLRTFCSNPIHFKLLQKLKEILSFLQDHF